MLLNLKMLYPTEYARDYYVTVSDEVAEVLTQSVRDEEAYRRRTYRHRAQYSLESRGGDYDVLIVEQALTPVDILEQKYEYEILYHALDRLPSVQSTRIYAKYIWGLTNVQIARAEGVTEGAVRSSIQLGLKNLNKILKDTYE